MSSPVVVRIVVRRRLRQRSDTSRRALPIATPVPGAALHRRIQAARVDPAPEPPTHAGGTPLSLRCSFQNSADRSEVRRPVGTPGNSAGRAPSPALPRVRLRGARARLQPPPPACPPRPAHSGGGARCGVGQSMPPACCRAKRSGAAGRGNGPGPIAPLPWRGSPAAPLSSLCAVALAAARSDPSIRSARAITPIATDTAVFRGRQIQADTSKRWFVARGAIRFERSVPL